MHQGGATPDGGRYVYGFHHLPFGVSLLQGIGRISVNAIGALHGVGNGKGNE